MIPNFIANLRALPDSLYSRTAFAQIDSLVYSPAKTMHDPISP
jgi:hypothetical protein